VPHCRLLINKEQCGTFFFKGEINMNFKVKNKNQTPKSRIILKTFDTLKGIFGGVVLEHVLKDVAEQVYKAIKSDLKPPPDLINYHEVVKLIKDMKFPNDDVDGREMADHNYLLDKVHKRLKEMKALSKKEE
jgi:hypothetical protein